MSGGSRPPAFSRLQWVVVLGGSVVTAVVTGIPTDIIPTPLFRRMTPVLWWNYPVWAATAMLAGLVLATYVRRAPTGASRGGLVGGGVFSFFAVGCPICNKLVVVLIGVSGALSYFAPLQPYLAAIGLGLMATTVVLRLRVQDACPSEA